MAQYSSAKTLASFMTGDVNVTTGSYHKIGEYQVQAKELVSLGSGKIESMEGAVGRIFADLKDNATTPLNIDGKVRFAVHSPQNQPRRTLIEFDTRQLRTVEGDRTKQAVLAEHWFPFVSEDNKIVIEFLPERNGVVSKANSTGLIDVTISYQ